MVKSKTDVLRIMVLVGLAVVFWGAGTAISAEVHHNGAFLFDEIGTQVQAHSAGVLKVGEFYYIFGENRNYNSSDTFFAVSCYRSTDLLNWEFRNHVLTPDADPELGFAKIERPKVIYNAATDTYVMWMHKEYGDHYGEARCAVASCDTVDGDYTYHGSFNPLGYMSRDCTLFVDDDQKGYFLSAANNNADLHLYQLSSDYLSIDHLVQVIWAGQSREAPCLFKRNGYYFIVSSGCTGWSPNQGKYGYATSLSGSWSSLYNVGNSTTYQSQSTFVLPIYGSSQTSYLFLGDRWARAWGDYTSNSRYVWMPLEFTSDTSMEMSYVDALDIDVETGLLEGVPGYGWVKLDDSDASVSYSSGWGTWSGNPGYMESEHYSEVEGSEATFTFTGTQARYYGFLRKDLGYADIYLDGELVDTVNCYANNAQYDYLLYETPQLTDESHTLMVHVTGDSDPSSSGYEIIVDAFAYYSTSGADLEPPFGAGTAYRVVNENSGRVLTVGDGDVYASDASVVQYVDAGAGWQRWEIETLGGGEYAIVNAESGLYLDIDGDPATNGSPVVQRAWDGSATQRWNIVKRPDGLYQVTTSASDKVLEVYSQSIADGATVALYSSNGGLNQFWQIEADSLNPWQKTYIEAESASGQADFSPFTVQSNGSTPASSSIIVAEGTGSQGTPTTGICDYAFSLSQPGRVKVWLLTQAPDDASSSMFVRLDTDPWVEVTVPVNSNWYWGYATQAQLAAGSHSVSVAWADDGIGLDTVLVAALPELTADLDGDGLVNLVDLKILTDYWLTAEAQADIAPAGGDGIVDMLDFAALAAEWSG